MGGVGCAGRRASPDSLKISQAAEPQGGQSVACLSDFLLFGLKRNSLSLPVQEEVALLKQERLSERQGRIKAERLLREIRVQSNTPASSNEPNTANGSKNDDTPPSGTLRHRAFPFHPIGELRSCFSRRNGTPRQPLLVSAARAALTLRPGLGSDFLEGLQQYSHCWVLYVFHENTDLQRLWQDSLAGVRGKIRVPRLNGARLGVFATRSPHRPCPIGLSVGRVLGVEGSTLLLGGLDVVDGSPVLDVKPYVPFCDAVYGATAPPWVAPEAEEQEPLGTFRVNLLLAADEALRRCWDARKRATLYVRYEDYKALVLEVLSRDIRSVTQRIKVPERRQNKRGVPTLDDDSSGRWHVILDGIDVVYEIDDENATITVCDAATDVR